MCWVLIFFLNLIEHSQAKAEDPDQSNTSLYAVSNLVLHCLPISHKKDARLMDSADS